MAVNPNTHKAVVIFNGGDAVFGFPHIYSAFSFVERQLSLVDDKAKAFSMLMEAATEDIGLSIDGNTYKIVDTDTYFDSYAEDLEEDEYPVAE